MRLGMRAGEPIRDLPIDRWHLLDCEFTNVVPAIRKAGLMEVATVFMHDATRLVRRRLLVFRVETQRSVSDSAPIPASTSQLAPSSSTRRNI